MQGPIGIFDSGVGGISIWREITRILPNENTLYLADGKNAPYGQKSKPEILQLSIKNTEYLLKNGCKIVVVACNTATTNAISYLRKSYEVPFIGIEPAIKPAALQSQTKKVGVLATKGTLSSALFHNTSKLHASGIEVLEQEGKGLVRLIEEGKINTEETLQLLKKYVEPMVAVGMDCLVLGCTHYPYLVPVLREILPQNVQIIDSGFAVAKQTKAVLLSHRLLNKSDEAPGHNFYTNTNPAVLSTLLQDSPCNISFLDF